ncbi:MAG: PAS domain-containing protein [bacterium]|nr:PAS domain-containing protein [bacterium]
MLNKPGYEELEQRVKELEHAEFQCKQAEEKLNNFIHSIPDTVLLFDSELNCLDINDAALKYYPTGTTREDVVGKQMLELSPGLDKTGRYDKYLAVVKTGISFYAEDVIPHEKFGNINLRVQAFKVSDGLGMVIVDTTERKQTEDALKENEEKFRSMQESMKDPVYICSADFKITYMNPVMIKRTGHDAVGEFCYRALHNLKEKCSWCVHDQVQKGKYLEIEFLSPKDNRSYSSSHSPIFHLDGTVSKITVYRDITERIQNEEKLNEYRKHLEELVEKRTAELEKEIIERKQVEAALRRNEARIRHAQEIAGLGYWDWNVVTGELYWSDQIYIHYGFEPQEFLPTFETFSSIVHPDELAFVQRNVNEALQNNAAYDIDFRFVRPDGEVRYLYTKGEVTRDDDGNALRFIGSQIDITDRKHAEKALQENEKYLKIAQKMAKLGHWKLLTETQEVEGSDELFNIFELNKNELTLEAFASVVHPDDLEYDMRHINNGIEKGEPWDIEHRLMLKDKTVKTIRAIGEPVVDETGTVTELIGTVQDITDRKKAEEQIKASLKEKETLLYEIHHRVKNNLAVVSSLLGLQAISMNDERLTAALMDSKNRVQSMSTIHETLYQSHNLSAIDLDEYLSKLVRDIVQNYAISKNVNLTIEAENILIGVKQASPVGLIINELITNSYKYAFPENREGEIKIKLQETENQIELEYSDDGIGFPEDFDWKNSKTLGLELVRTLVEKQLGGSIELESNNGVRFMFKFNIKN